jgi:hypothetical protein
MKVKVFLQSELLSDIEVVEVDSDGGHSALRTACLAKVNLQPDEKFFIFIEDEDDEHAFEKLNQVNEGIRIQLHRLKSIDVIVRYAGKDVLRSFRPSTTVGRVKKWATHELGVAPSDAAELMLQIRGTDNRPDADIHIGTLVKAPEHKLEFDLVPSPRVNG